MYRDVHARKKLCYQGTKIHAQAYTGKLRVILHTMAMAEVKIESYNKITLIILKPTII